MTWRALTENYLKSIEGKKRPSTVQQLTRILRHDDLAAWRERPAVSITADDVRAVRDHIHDDRGSPVQSTCVLRAISGLGTWATEEGKLNVSPARDVKARGKANERDRILSDGRVQSAAGGPVARIYNQFEYESERAEALDKLGEFITALASPRVVPLRRA